jgi:penicillin-binding protein 1B
MAKKSRTSRKKKSRRRRVRGRRLFRLRTLVNLGITFAVLLAASVIYLSVTVSSRFDGRLWKIPSKVFSAPMVLTRGAEVPHAEVLSRLKRGGYAQTTGPPTRPGQYRSQDASLEIHVRPFAAPGFEMPSQHVRLRFSRDRIVALSDSQGRRIGRLLLEPEEIATLFGVRHEERRLVRLTDLPEPFMQAVLAAEDSRFYSHHGLDLRGIARAGVTNLSRGRIVQGGSTITQQTVKNLFLGSQRTWWRKIRESLMSLVLDGNYPKDRILEVYLNEVYWGQRGPVAICGAGAAARFYFGKDLSHLSVGEWATLAGLIRSPGRYNPFRHPERAIERRDQVLDAMRRLQFLDEAAYTTARAEPLQLASGSGGGGGAPYFVDHVRNSVAERYTAQILQEEGLNIYTTLDSSLQEKASLALRRGLERLERDRPALLAKRGKGPLQGAVIVLRPGSGEVLAMVGGRDYSTTQFNRAVQAHRQPGSCFKPFVFATGFEQAHRDSQDGLSPATLLADDALELVIDGKSWRPANYDGQYRGAVPARRALEESLNVPTIRAALMVGLEPIIETARRCGIRSHLSPVPSLALGTEEVTPLELAAAYGAFAQQGSYVAPQVVNMITDQQGELLEGRVPERRWALSSEAAYLVTDILQGVFTRGTAKSAAALGYHELAAGKTGTTDDMRDAWFVGYTPDLLALVWVGFDDGRGTGLTGATGALPIWVDLMKQAGSPVSRWPREPGGIVRLRIDPLSGQLAVRACPKTMVESFTEGSQPPTECDLHQGRIKRWWRNLGGRKRETI